MRSFVLLTAAAAAAGTLAAATAVPSYAFNRLPLSTHRIVSLRHRVEWNRTKTWHFEDFIGKPRTVTDYAERRTRSVAFLRWLDHRWNRRRIAAKRRAVRYQPKIAHWHLWSCIHDGEGNSSPSSSHPYSGPLQMTSYWAGYPVYDWSTVPVRVVYSDAETQLQIHLRQGNVYAWLSQQWQGTSPPCLRYL